MMGNRRSMAALTASALLFATWLVTGCSGPSYPVLDSGHAAFEDEIVWLDNYRVLFRGFEGELATTAKRKGLYIWDTRTNQVTWYGKGGGHLCYYEGYVYYGFYNGAQTTKEYPYLDSWKEGPFGKEEYHIHRYKSGGGISRNNALKRSHVDCRLHRHEVVDQGFWIPLREHDGPLVIHMNDRKVIYRGQLLPVSSVYSLDFTDIRFVSRKDAYFLQQGAGVGRIGWDENGGCLPVYWLHPDGGVQDVCVPHGPWSQNGIDAVTPTRRGLVLQDSEMDSDRNWETALYLVEKKNVWHRLIRGRVGRTVASPDGCRIAFTHYLDTEIMSPDVPGNRTVKMMDLCSAKYVQ
ncbi:MAG: hypothetical protein L0H73_10395 [Nitrococcus sp.]|nr:hypothetical protein [Nitrococcus sp.]